jgi:uncharacterized protein (TIGR03435 family)
MRSKLTIPAWGLALGLCAELHGQLPAFDVASVRANRSEQLENSIQLLPNGRFAATNTTVRSLILRAYKVHESQVIGGPEWIERERFDVDARAATPPPDGPEALIPMLKTLLSERFALRSHTESRQLPAYVLTRAQEGRLGPQIRPTQADCSGQRVPTQEEIRASVRDGWPPCGMVFVVNFTTRTPAGSAVEMRFRRSATSIDDLAAAFPNAVGRPVVNRTGLDGRYDVEYSYTPQPADPGVTSAFQPDTPGLFAAVEEQLGLKLQAERTEVPVMVIDAIERPTEN